MVESINYVPTIEQPEIQQERLKIPNYALLGVFTTSLEKAKVEENTLAEYKKIMISDNEPNLADGNDLLDNNPLLLHLDVPPRNVDDPRKFMVEVSRSMDMIAGYCQAIPEIRYVYGTSYLSAYSKRYGFETEDLPADSLAAKISLEMYKEARGARHDGKLPIPQLAFIDRINLLEKSNSELSDPESLKKQLGILTLEHQRFERRRKALSNVSQDEMKNYCVGNTLKIELSATDDPKEIYKSLDMLAGYIQAFPSIWNIYITETSGFESALEEAGFRDLSSDDCPIFEGHNQMQEQGGKLGATIIELKEFAVHSSDKIRPIETNRAA